MSADASLPPQQAEVSDALEERLIDAE